jgi:hypothetical protein
MTDECNPQASISIDTSSLNEILKTDETVEEFFKILESRNIALNIPSDCLMELANGKWIHDATKQKGASYRLQRFVKLAEKFYGEGKILLNEMPQKIIANEVKNLDIRHRSIGCVKGANIALFATERHKQIHGQVLEAHASRKEAKSAAKAKDQEVKASKVISSSDAEKYLLSFEAIQADPNWRDFLHSQFIKYIFGENVSFEAFNKILDGHNCAVVISFVNLLLVHHIAIFLDETNCREALKPLIEIEENSLPDILIASMVAYSDYFICDDACLRARCEFLRNLGVIKFTTITLEEFSSRCKSNMLY